MILNLFEGDVFRYVSLGHGDPDWTTEIRIISALDNLVIYSFCIVDPPSGREPTQAGGEVDELLAPLNKCQATLVYRRLQE